VEQGRQRSLEMLRSYRFAPMAPGLTHNGLSRGSWSSSLPTNGTM
jgi:hypothetical protein